MIEYAYTFDAAGRLTGFSVDDSDVDFTYTYDAAGYLLSAEWDFASLADDVTLTYGYDAGDLTSTQATIGTTADFSNAYTYDGLGRLTSVAQQDVAGGNAVADKYVEFTYTDSGWLEQITRYSDLAGTSLVATTDYTYDDDLGWLTGLVHSINNTNQDVISYGYTYEADGQISTIDSSEDGLYEYDYDNQGQLVGVDIDSVDAEDYQYDANGNRTGATVDGVTTSYTTTAYNRLESVDDGTTITVYGYDAEGNLVLEFVDDGDGVFDSGDTDVVEYTWDHRNRLTSVTNYDTFSDYHVTSSQEVEYGYDYLNRLVERTVDEDGAGVTESPTSEYFVYDLDASSNWALEDSSTSEDGTIPFGADPSTDAGQIVLQLDENGDPTHRYLWGPAVDLLLADETVDDGDVEDNFWTLGDHQNSIRDILIYNDIADEFEIGNHITNSSYGIRVSETNAAVDCAFSWTGRYLDELSGLQYNHNRPYGAPIGRWTNEDKIGYAAGDANLYRYCGNDPVNSVDPSGLADWVWPWDPRASWNPVDTAKLWIPAIWEHGGKEAVLPPGSASRAMHDSYVTAKDEAGRGMQVFKNARHSKYGVIGSMYQAGGVVVGDLIGVTNFSYWFDNTDPVKGVRVSPLEQYGRAILGTAQLAVEAYFGAQGLHALRGPKVTPEGINLIEEHLSQFGEHPPNSAMIERLKSGLATPEDIAFYEHELLEARLMAQGMDASSAHLETLRQQGIPFEPGYESKLFPPEVIRKFSEFFNFAAWPK